MEMEKTRVSSHFKFILVLLTGALLAGCSPKTGVVNITSEPGVANIYINEKLRGVTGNVQSEYLTLRLEYGIYQVHAQKSVDANTEFFGERVVVVTGDGDQWINIALKQRPTLQSQSLAAAGAVLETPEDPADTSRTPVANVPSEPLGEWVTIPGGAFIMGTSDGPIDERPEHVVVVPPFRMMATEVTFNLWDQCVREGGCAYSPNDEGWGRGERPVINVSYEDITNQFIPWISRKTQRSFMLPSEAQWEYAIRAGTQTDYYWGDKPAQSLANCAECGSEWDGRRTAPVKSFEPNPFGLYDMAGNVWEWAEDCWNDDYRKSPDHSLPRYDGQCNQRVLRGGSWGIGATRMRSAYRNWSEIKRRNIDVGFRLVENLESEWILDEAAWPEAPEAPTGPASEDAGRAWESKGGDVRNSSNQSAPTPQPATGQRSIPNQQPDRNLPATR